MNELINTLSALGASSFSWLWMPLLAWSVLALGLFGLLWLMREQVHPLLQYRTRVVLLLALPLGIGLALLVSLSAGLLAGQSAALETVVVIQHQAADRLADAIRSVPNSPAASTTASLDAAFWLGLATLLAGAVALWRMSRLVAEAVLLGRYKAGLHFVDSREVEHRAGTAPGPAGLQDTAVRYAVVEDAAVMPMTFGWRRPVVVLPAWLLDQKQDLHMVLLHELVHIRRRDYLGQWIARVVDAFFAIHPLVRHLIKQIDRYRELACDAEVLARARFGAHAYASLLYQMLRVGGGRSARPALSLAEHPSTLRTRIKTMEHQTYTTQRWQGARRVSIVVSATLFLLSTVFVACSELATESDLQARLQIEGASFTIYGGHLYVNETLINTQGEFGLTAPCAKPFFIHTPETGLFMLALTPLADFEPAGRIEGHDLRFAVKDTRVRILSSTPILGGESATLYVRYDPSYPRRQLSVPGRMATMPGFTVGSTDSFGRLYKDHMLPEAVETRQDAYQPPFQFNSPSLELNGTTYSAMGGSAKTSLEGYIALHNPAYGRLVFSGVPFQGAEPVAHVDGKIIRVETASVRLTLTSAAPILRPGETPILYFRHDPGLAPASTRDGMRRSSISAAVDIALLSD